ncbi:uncharacterized protein LOC142555206 isoform X2 [Primulina tabacum]|uniref:uncharacterized protein LOC142555206 isoform X2 n=1 Tax=Primulina tabacum TaxID=48773 RepID=UPI003F594652
MASWLESLMSPAKTWAVSRRLRKYGNILNSYLNGGTKAEAEIKPLPSLKEVEKIIGYSFNNRSLLDQAFTHPSYHKDCVSYERLEYVGDSVLNLLVAKEQFSMYPNLPPGSLTPLRAANVDTEKLARAAVQHNFHLYVRHENPVLKKRVSSCLLSSRFELLINFFCKFSGTYSINFFAAFHVLSSRYPLFTCNYLYSLTSTSPVIAPPLFKTTLAIELLEMQLQGGGGMRSSAVRRSREKSGLEGMTASLWITLCCWATVVVMPGSATWANETKNGMWDEQDAMWIQKDSFLGKDYCLI